MEDKIARSPHFEVFPSPNLHHNHTNLTLSGRGFQKEAKIQTSRHWGKLKIFPVSIPLHKKKARNFSKFQRATNIARNFSKSMILEIFLSCTAKTENFPSTRIFRSPINWGGGGAIKHRILANSKMKRLEKRHNACQKGDKSEFSLQLSKYLALERCGEDTGTACSRSWNSSSLKYGLIPKRHY